MSNAFYPDWYVMGPDGTTRPLRDGERPSWEMEHRRVAETTQWRRDPPQLRPWCSNHGLEQDRTTALEKAMVEAKEHCGHPQLAHGRGVAVWRAHQRDRAAVMNRRRYLSWDRKVHKVSDIPITRRFHVECPQHGVIDEPEGYADAVAARRSHYFTAHREDS